MKVGIMQPYFFPYLGYWQLINAVDTFVILDDVNYIKKGFINSNSILVNNEAYKFTIPLEKASQNKLINETKLNFSQKDKEKFLKTIYISYKRSPFFDAVYPVIEHSILYDNSDLTEYIKYSIDQTKLYLGITTDIVYSSKIKKDNTLKAQERIIEINKKLGASIYINANGGRSLYSKLDFERNKIELKFIQMERVVYEQLKNKFVPNLSIIDVLMFNSIDSIKQLLDQYILYT
ncbi:MAG: WbqC family protein [Lachnospiraceae bacterium]|nr:WbqC family protein [Lachnospiraceae bacterium]